MAKDARDKGNATAPLDKRLNDAAKARFDFECPRTWNSLAPTPNQQVRHCDDCDRQVHLSRDVREAEMNSRAGHCVALVMPEPPRRALVLRIWDAAIAALRVLTHGRSPLPPDAIPDAPLLPPRPRVTVLGQFHVGHDGPPVVGWLVPLEGPRRGETLLLRDGESIVGSDEAAALRIDGEGIAPLHCRIHKSPVGFMLVDAGSPGGTHVGGRRIDRFDLVDGDVIAIGDTRLRFKTTL